VTTDTTRAEASGASASPDDAPRATAPAIEVEGLSKRYGEVDAVRDLSFAIHAGEVVGFLGPNGAGKTTTMRMLTGFIPPTDGLARIAGHDIFEDPVEARRAIGYLPETPPLYPEMARCGLQDMRRREIRQLSKGYRQRVGLAQAIVHEPKVLVLDEPTVGLDPIQIREIRALIADLAATGGQTVILSTHILAEVEAICQRVILIGRGRMVLDQPLSELTSGGVSLEEIFARVMTRDVHADGEEDAA